MCQVLSSMPAGTPESSAVVDLRMAFDKAEQVSPGISSKLMGGVLDVMAENEVIRKGAISSCSKSDMLFTAAAKPVVIAAPPPSPVVEFLYNRWVKQQDKSK